MRKLLVFVVMLFLSGSAYALRQSTQQIVSVGPLLNGTTRLAGEKLYANQIRLSKAGGAFTAYHTASIVTADANGNARITLDTTDTNTPGKLILDITEPNVVPKLYEFEVLSPSPNVWYVAKDGNDNNTGFAYPDGISAKLTIQAAINAASNGDEIIVGPGTYDEKINLAEAAFNLTVKGNGHVVISNDSANYVVNLGPASTLERLTIENTHVQALGLSAVFASSDASNLRIKDCHLISNGDTIALNDVWKGAFIENCLIEGSENGICWLSTDESYQLTVLNCHITARDWTNCAGACAYLQGGQIFIKDTLCFTSIVDTNSGHPAIGILGGGAATIRTQITCENVYVKLESTTGGYKWGFGMASIGVASESRMHLINCGVSIKSNVVTTGDYDIQNENCIMSVVNCDYDRTKTSGTIIDVVDGIASDPNLGLIKGQTNKLIFASNGGVKAYDPNLPSVKTDTAAIKTQTDKMVFANNRVNANATVISEVTVTGGIALTTTVDANSGNSPRKAYMVKSSAFDNAYKDMLVMITDITDPNDTQVRRITSSSASTKSIDLDYPLDFTPANGDLVYIQGYQKPEYTGR